MSIEFLCRLPALLASWLRLREASGLGLDQPGTAVSPI